MAKLIEVDPLIPLSQCMIQAYECYLRARLETWRWSKDGLDHALRLIQNGLDIVGDNELLYAAQGNVYVRYRQAGIDTGDANLRKAEECVEKIFALNPDSHHGHGLSGHLYRIRGNVQAAVRRLKRALAADPNNADTLIELSYAYIISGKGFAARPMVAKAMEVDPLIPLTQCLPGFSDAFLDGHFDTAIEPHQRMYAMDPDNPMALLFYTFILASNGMTEEASRVIDASSSTAKRTLPGQMALALHFASEGEAQNAADAMTPELQAMASASDDLFPRVLGQGYAMIDHKEEAVHWLTMAADRKPQPRSRERVLRRRSDRRAHRGSVQDPGPPGHLPYVRHDAERAGNATSGRSAGSWMCDMSWKGASADPATRSALMPSSSMVKQAVSSGLTDSIAYLRTCSHCKAT